MADDVLMGTGKRTATLATAVGCALAAAAVPAAADTPVRVIASGKAYTDAAGQRWKPAGSRLDGRRVRRTRGTERTESPGLYRVVADGSRRLRLTVRRPGRYAVTLYHVEPRGSGASRRLFHVQAAGDGALRRDVDVPVGGRLAAVSHTTLETVVTGTRLELRFTPERGRVAVAAAEARRLGDVTMPPISAAFGDDFDGPAGTSPDPARWEVQHGARWGANQLQAYQDDPDTVGLDGEGVLRIVARRERAVDSKGRSARFTSGRLHSHETFSMRRVHVEATIDVPGGRGLWPAFWTLGVHPPAWPKSGEIDIMEMVGQRPNVLHAFVHGPARPGQGAVYQNGAVFSQDAPITGTPHTFAMHTEPGVVEFWLDGRRYGSVARADIPRGTRWLLDRPQHLIFSLAIGGWAGEPSSSTPFPAVMAVDRVLLLR